MSKPKAVEEMSVKGLQSKATQHFDRAMQAHSKGIRCTDNPKARGGFFLQCLMEKIQMLAAVSELARRARAAEKTTTGKDGKR